MSIVTSNEAGGSPSPLNYDERATLGACEDVICRGRKTFVEVGEAFAAISELRLYRETHTSFEAYCTERWQISKRYAYNLIEAAEVTRDVCAIAHIPASESVVRPLAPLSTEERKQAWKHAVDNSPNGKPTANRVQRSVEYVRTGIGGMKSAAPLHTILTSSNSDEYYTPREVVDAVLECFDGVIELDPGSNSREFPNVPAKTVYTIADDGLSYPWKARTLYTNPPYSDVKAWMQKLSVEYDSGNVVEAIALVKADTSTQWFALGFERAAAVCFVNRRLIFHTPGEVQNQSAPFASALIYFGKHVGKFYHAFEGRIGVCMQRIQPNGFEE